MKHASSASVSYEEGGPSSPPPFAAESSRQRSAQTAERIRKASAPSSVWFPREPLPVPAPHLTVHALHLHGSPSPYVCMLCAPLCMLCILMVALVAVHKAQCQGQYVLDVPAPGCACMREGLGHRPATIMEACSWG